MKKDLDTVSVELERERVYLQVSRGYQEQERRWYEWQEMLHEHVVYEMDIVICGSCHITVEGKTSLLQAGEAMVIAPRQHHGCRSLEGEFAYFSFFFQPDERAASITAALSGRIPGSWAFPASPAMLETSRTILQDWDGAPDQPYRTEKRRALLTVLLIDMFRQLALARPLPQDVGKEPSRMFLCDSFFSGPGGNKSAAELAALLRMSERQMNRCLQEYYGMNFRQKLVSTRMEGAAYLLSRSKMGVEEIVSMVGYSSESGFFKAFRRRYGMTPLEYRTRYSLKRPV